jgi:hypothetical protein
LLFLQKKHPCKPSRLQKIGYIKSVMQQRWNRRPQGPSSSTTCRRGTPSLKRR